MLDRLGSRRRRPPVTPIFEAWFEHIADGTIPGHLIATLWRRDRHHPRAGHGLLPLALQSIRATGRGTAIYLPILVLLAHRHVLRVLPRRRHEAADLRAAERR
jgi:hypothetical protein